MACFDILRPSSGTHSFYKVLCWASDFRFRILYTDASTPWTVDQPVARPLPTHRTKETQNKSIQTSRLRVGFEPRTPVFKIEKAVDALGVIGFSNIYVIIENCLRLNNTTKNLSRISRCPVRYSNQAPPTCASMRRRNPYIF
jgi:hypothetical protein